MQSRIVYISYRVLGLVLLLSIFSQCAWFQKDPLETEIIKPTPVGGYEELGTRIYYPKQLREKGIEGEIVVKALVSIEGLVSQTRVTQKLDPELDRIATNAVQRTLFNPALRNGEFAEVWISIPILFTLKDWQRTETPFLKFEMLVHPNSSYQNFDVSIHAQLKPHMILPLRFELLLPYNVEKSWVKSGDSQLEALRMRDQEGEWLVFQADDLTLDVGFNYRPFNTLDQHSFEYKFSMNHALPDWELIMTYGDQQVQFVQTPNRVSTGTDGVQRVAYELRSLDAYEAKYLEVALLK